MRDELFEGRSPRKIMAHRRRAVAFIPFTHGRICLVIFPPSISLNEKETKEVFRRKGKSYIKQSKS